MPLVNDSISTFFLFIGFTKFGANGINQIFIFCAEEVAFSFKDRRDTVGVNRNVYRFHVVSALCTDVTGLYIDEIFYSLCLPSFPCPEPVAGKELDVGSFVLVTIVQECETLFTQA